MNESATDVIGQRRGTSVIYHNPRCSTSRNALQLLRDNGIEPTVVEYLKTPPTRGQLADMIRDAGIDVRTAVRKREAPYADLGLGERRRRRVARRDGREPDPDRAPVRRDAEGHPAGSAR